MILLRKSNQIDFLFCYIQKIEILDENLDFFIETKSLLVNMSIIVETRLSVITQDAILNCKVYILIKNLSLML